MDWKKIFLLYHDMVQMSEGYDFIHNEDFELAGAALDGFTEEEWTEMIQAIKEWTTA